MEGDYEITSCYVISIFLRSASRILKLPRIKFGMEVKGEGWEGGPIHEE